MNGDSETNIGMVLSAFLFVIGAIGSFFVSISNASIILLFALLLVDAECSLCLYYIAESTQRLRELSNEFARYERACEHQDNRHAEEVQALLKKLIELKEQELAVLQPTANDLIVGQEPEEASVVAKATEETASQELRADEEEQKQEDVSASTEDLPEESIPSDDAEHEVEPSEEHVPEETTTIEEISIEPPAETQPDVDCTASLKRATKADLEQGFVYGKSNDRAIGLLKKGWKK